MIWLIAIGVIGFILFSFLSELNQDKQEFRRQSLTEKFAIVAGVVNDAAFNGRGKVKLLNDRNFTVYEEGQNQIIHFQYSTGHLTINWRYKYFQKEVVHTRQFDNVRNLSIFEQQKIGERMVTEMIIVIEKHQNDVIGGAL